MFVFVGIVVDVDVVRVRVIVFVFLWVFCNVVVGYGCVNGFVFDNLVVVYFYFFSCE